MKLIDVVFERSATSGGGHQSRATTLAHELLQRGHEVKLNPLASQGEYRPTDSDLLIVDCADAALTREILRQSSRHTARKITIEHTGDEVPFPDLNVAVFLPHKPEGFPTQESLGFAFLRDKIIQAEALAEEEKPLRKPKTCLLTFGRLDPKNHLVGCFEQLKRSSQSEAEQNCDWRFELVESYRGQLNRDGLPSQCQILFEPEDFAQRLASAQLVLCSGGVTALEANYLKRPSLLLPQTENEVLFCEHIFHLNGTLGVVQDLECLHLPEILNQAEKFSPTRLVDGQGKTRVAELCEEVMFR